MHSMICRTDGILRTAPVRWRSFERMCAVHWEARATSGATGYYRAPDPRVMLFFNDVSGIIRLADQSEADPAAWRPMLRALYVPAGVPMWTSFNAAHNFSHLDLHLDGRWLLDRLSPMLGHDIAAEALRRPAEVQDVGSLAALAQALAGEIGAPSRAPAFAESLAVALVTGLVAPAVDAEDEAGMQGGLTPWQMRRLRAFLESRGGKASNAEPPDPRVPAPRRDHAIPMAARGSGPLTPPARPSTGARSDRRSAARQEGPPACFAGGPWFVADLTRCGAGSARSRGRDCSNRSRSRPGRCAFHRRGCSR